MLSLLLLFSVDMILNIDQRDQSGITQVHVITHLIVPEIFPVAETETMVHHRVNETILHITRLHETILPVIETTHHLVVEITHPADVITHRQEMILRWLLVVILPGTVFFS